LPAIASAVTWELAGRTYNSAGFIDRSHIVSRNDAKLVALMCISAQLANDGWKEVEQQLAIRAGAGRIIRPIFDRRFRRPPSFTGASLKSSVRGSGA
jgi:hypothetical protein